MSSIPIITIDEIASCLDKNSVNYSVYYGTSSSNISSTPNAGQAKASLNTNISLNKGNGYYRIKITGKLNNSQVTLTKNYYAIVNKSGEKTAPIINYANATKTSSSSLKINISINETGSGLKEIKYCLTSSTTSCDATKLTLKSFSPVQKGTSIVVSTTASNSLLSSFKKACFNAYDNDGNKSRGICVNIA